jgi:hypothetical protein
MTAHNRFSATGNAAQQYFLIFRSACNPAKQAISEFQTGMIANPEAQGAKDVAENAYLIS